jgi:hypothetical protein
VTRPIAGDLDVARSRTRTEPVPFLQQPGAAKELNRQWWERLRSESGR